jgi:hypothetical protein
MYEYVYIHTQCVYVCGLSAHKIYVAAFKSAAKDNFSQLPFYFTFYRKLSSVLHIFENLLPVVSDNVTITLIWVKICELFQKLNGETHMDGIVISWNYLSL